MKEREDDIDDILGKYLSGEASAKEIDRAERWIADNPGNEKYFRQIQAIFDAAPRMKRAGTFNADAAWEKVRGRIVARNGGAPLEKQRSLMPVWLKVAASIVVVSLIAFAGYRFLAVPSAQAHLVTEVKTHSDTLPDGTSVFLNKQTELRYSFNRLANDRLVILRGEAFFDIKEDKENDFVVVADDISIRDIGTAFNVKAYPGSSTIEVFVQEGEVICSTPFDTVTVGANAKAIYDKNMRRFMIEQPQPNEVAYKTRSFVFSDITLGEIVEQLNTVYGENIQVGPSLTTCRLSVSFNGESMEEIANIIAETLSLNIRRSGNLYMLEGIGCPN